MAMNVYLSLKADGTDIEGDSTVSSMDRENTIECTLFDDGVSAAREAGSGMATGRRRYDPIKIRKRIDKATPLIAKALCNNEVIEGIFKFYRPNPAGDGTTEHFFTIDIKGGRVSSIQHVSPDTMDPVETARPAEEEVEFLFSDITWTFEDGGLSHMDSWSGAT